MAADNMNQPERSSCRISNHLPAPTLSEELFRGIRQSALEARTKNENNSRRLDRSEQRRIKPAFDDALLRAQAEMLILRFMVISLADSIDGRAYVDLLDKLGDLEDAFHEMRWQR